MQTQQTVTVRQTSAWKLVARVCTITSLSWLAACVASVDQWSELGNPPPWDQITEELLTETDIEGKEGVIVVSCVFDTSNSPMERMREKGVFTEQYQVDMGTKNSYIVNERGMRPVEAHWGFNFLTFIDKIPGFAVFTTTVVYRSDPKGLQGNAVRSLNVLPMGRGDLAPSQHRGLCSIKSVYPADDE